MLPPFATSIRDYEVSEAPILVGVWLSFGSPGILLLDYLLRSTKRCHREKEAGEISASNFERLSASIDSKPAKPSIETLPLVQEVWIFPQISRSKT